MDEESRTEDKEGQRTCLLLSIGGAKMAVFTTPIMRKK